MAERPSSNWLSDQAFTQAVSALPLVSLDLVIINSQDQILLGLRKHSPAKDWWFTPGGRIRKNEPWRVALERIWKEEIFQINYLLSEDLKFLDAARLMGIYDHFYDDSSLSSEVSTHYVNLPHLVCLEDRSEELDLVNEQHSACRWWDLNEVMDSPKVHTYVKPYAEWVLKSFLNS